MSDPVLAMAGISKVYGGLRPLRIAELRVAAAEAVALLGFDQPTAETFVNLATGATLPDGGDVHLFGRLTRHIEDSADWLSTVDRLGIVGERAVLLDALTPIQNLAMPFTLDIEPPPVDVRERADALAAEVGIQQSEWAGPVARLDALGRVRLRLGRALALDPAILVLEHVTAGVERSQIATLGEGIRAIATRRGSASVALTADEEFAAAVATRVFRLEPATGRLVERGAGFFGRFFRS